MPNKTIYIRQADEQKWEAIENKAEFIHSVLNADSITVSSSDVPQTPDNPSQLRQISKKKALVGEYVPVKSCKHGADPKFCKFASPGKLCK